MTSICPKIFPLNGVNKDAYIHGDAFPQKNTFMLFF